MTEPPRLRYIDCARGLFVLLMISSHALGIAQVPADSFLQSVLWLPKGWSTAGFVMLAGFSVGVMTIRGRPIPTRTLLVRASQLLLLMVVSNALFATGREMVYGDIGNLRDVEWFIDVMTLQRQTTISLVLLPIALGLVSICAIQPLSRHIAPVVLTAAIVVMNVLAWAAHDLLAAKAAADAATHWMFTSTIELHLLPQVSGATAGFALGLIWRSLADSIKIDSRVVGPVVLIALVVMAPIAAAAPRPVFLTADVIAQFLIILVLALSLAALPLLTGISNLAALLGRFSLMVFILHRVLLQTADLCARGFQMTPMPRYFFVVILCVGGSALVCSARTQSMPLHRAMRRLLM
jgi:hypothetical protein